MTRNFTYRFPLIPDSVDIFLKKLTPIRETCLQPLTCNI